MRRGARRPAFALLDAVVGLTILATAAIAAVTASASAVRQLEQVRESELVLERADAFLHAVSLWPTADLDRRLGARAQGEWFLTITRPEVGFYLVQLRDSSSMQPILRTALTRGPGLTDE